MYIYISYLKGVFNLLLIGTWSGKRMIDYQDLSTLLVPIHVTSMPFWARLLPSSDSTAQNQWYLHVVPHGVFLIFHIKEHILYHIIIYILYIIIHHLHPLNSRSNSSGGSSKYRATWGYKRGLHGQWPYRQLEADAKRDFEFALKPGNSGTGDAIATRKQTDLCHVDPCESGLNFRFFFGFNMMFVRNYLNEP
jgi:hypothetical protein